METLSFLFEMKNPAGTKDKNSQKINHYRFEKEKSPGKNFPLVLME